jgi:fatty acid desaturase
MLDVTEERRTRRHTAGRVFWAIVCGVTVAALVVSRLTSELSGASALSWLAHFWLFEFVFGVTATLIATWGRDDDGMRQGRERQRRERRLPSPHDYV